MMDGSPIPFSARRFALRRAPAVRQRGADADADARPVFRARDGAELPPQLDLAPRMPPVLNQGTLGSCGPHAASVALRYLFRRAQLPDIQPSRLYTYYTTRVCIAQGAPTQDAGVDMHQLMASLERFRVCDEACWPYDQAKLAEAPPLAAFQGATLHDKRLICEEVEVHPAPPADQQQPPEQSSPAPAPAPAPEDAGEAGLRTLKAALWDEGAGCPVMCGIAVYDSMEAAITGHGAVPVPADDAQPLGGHAICLVGYNDATQQFKFQNSWGAEVGDGGYFYLPYAFVAKPALAFDFFRARLV